MTLNRIEANNVQKNNFYNLYFQCCIFGITSTTWEKSSEQKKDTNENKTKRFSSAVVY